MNSDVIVVLHWSLKVVRLGGSRAIASISTSVCQNDSEMETRERGNSRMLAVERSKPSAVALERSSAVDMVEARTRLPYSYLVREGGRRAHSAAQETVLRGSDREVNPGGSWAMAWIENWT
jgi:hypothetical protein